MRGIFIGIFSIVALLTVDALSNSKRIAPREPGRWAATFGAFGDIPLNEKVRRHYKSGLGFGARAGYGFLQGLSAEVDFQYDLLFKEGGSNRIKQNKSLISLAPGLRFTADMVPDMSWYALSLFGVTFDYTKSISSTWNLSYLLGTGIDFGITENLFVGPTIRYRSVLSDERKTDYMKIQLLSIGVTASYLYD